MKLLIYPLIVLLIFASCTKEQPKKEIVLKVKFGHFWNDFAVHEQDLENTTYAIDEKFYLNFSRLRYLISDLQLESEDGRLLNINHYHLVDLSDLSTLTITIPQSVETGKYKHLRFRLGFEDSDNKDGAYNDLNAASWNVPEQLGGGYHFMQLDGKYGTDPDVITDPFNYHFIRAVDATDPDKLILEDTSIPIDLGAVDLQKDVTIHIDMKLEQWFKNPVDWDLNTWNTTLMPNFNAQKAMHQNGQNVFEFSQNLPD